jgi:hypothetical protein
MSISVDRMKIRLFFFGDGVDDFDQLISRLEINRQYNRARGQFIYCDVGDSYSSWRPADLEDI